MSLPPLPLLLYVGMTWLPSPRKVIIYLQEKQLPSSVVKVIPNLDEEASKGYPKIVGKAASAFTGPTVPKLAVAKHANPSTNQDDYIWLAESVAIIEYLEDLCDAHPELSPVPSLRRGNNLIQRSLMRAEIMREEGLWMVLGSTLVLGSQTYNAMQQSSNVHIPSVQAVVKTTHTVILEKLDELLGQIVDFDGLAQNKVGAATIADIVLFGTLQWYRVCHGAEVSKGFPNMERFMEAWGKRKTRLAGVPEGGYPDMIVPFREGFTEEVWPKPTSYE